MEENKKGGVLGGGEAQPRKLPELLAPAGSLSHLRAAILAGADAVYMGGQRFGARAYAQNFSGDDIIEALHFAHFYGRKLYLTVNTLLKPEEIDGALYDFLLPYYEAGLDGVIVQDLGAVRGIRAWFPEMEIHASTQMTITDVYGARAAERMGMTRIVPARELSLLEIAHLKEQTGLEVEVFVHGALCYCYSGQCLLSSKYGDRSGNRGRCAQPCRLAYRLYDAKGRACRTDGRYLLSPRDLCSLATLPELVRIGVNSLKIEGRMKNVEYVAGVTAIYRKYLDRLAALSDVRDYRVEEEDWHRLEELYCRTQFTDGYWERHNGPEMLSVRSPKNTGRLVGSVVATRKNKVTLHLEADLSPKDILVIPLDAEGDRECVLTVSAAGAGRKGTKVTLNAPSTREISPGRPVYRRRSEALSAHILCDILGKEKKLEAAGEVVLRIGHPASLVLRSQGETVTLLGALVERSKKHPLQEGDVLRQMQKTGNVPFALSALSIDLEAGSFLPMSALKKLRQEGFRLLKEKLEARGERTKPAFQMLPEKEEDDWKVAKTKSTMENPLPKRERIATVYGEAQFAQVLADSFFDGICLPWEFFSPEELLRCAKSGVTSGRKLYLALPHVFRSLPQRKAQRAAFGEVAASPLWSGVYVYTVNEAEYLEELPGFSGRGIAAASLYHWNAHAERETADIFPSIQTLELPAELSGAETERLLFRGDGAHDFELLVHGRLPLMQSAQCLKKTAGRCDRCPEIWQLRDRKDRILPVTTHCADCYNLIWQDRPTSLIGEDLTGVIAKLCRLRFDLFGLSKKELDKMKKQYMLWEKNGFQAFSDKEAPEHHWNLGIE